MLSMLLNVLVLIHQIDGKCTVSRQPSHGFPLGPFYTRPKLCPSASWNPVAKTFANSTDVGTSVWDLFVDRDDSVYVNARSLFQILVWSANSTVPTRTIQTTIDSFWTNTIFVTENGDIYRDSSDNGTAFRISRWTPNATIGLPVMYVDSRCSGLAVDDFGSIYCSLNNTNRVTKRMSNESIYNITTIAGNGTAGAGSNMLSDPRSIIVTA